MRLRIGILPITFGYLAVYGYNIRHINIPVHNNTNPLTKFKWTFSCQSALVDNFYSLSDMYEYI